LVDRKQRFNVGEHGRDILGRENLRVPQSVQEQFDDNVEVAHVVSLCLKQLKDDLLSPLLLVRQASEDHAINVIRPKNNTRFAFGYTRPRFHPAYHLPVAKGLLMMTRLMIRLLSLSLGCSGAGSSFFASFSFFGCNFFVLHELGTEAPNVTSIGPHLALVQAVPRAVLLCRDGLVVLLLAEHAALTDVRVLLPE